MPSAQVIVSFREGLKILQQSNESAILHQTIDSLVSMCPVDEEGLAKDAIARVIRIKQAEEATKYQQYPEAMKDLSERYRKLYITLKSSKTKAKPEIEDTETDRVDKKSSNEMAKIPSLGISFPAILQWASTHKKYLFTGGAVASTVGGAYWLYKHFTDIDKHNNSEKESSLERTIKSIQTYKAFTQMVKDPDFSGDYAELISGKAAPKKRKAIKKKEDPQKSREWERDEKALMGDMDTAFNSLSSRPKLSYALPQLPAPKNIDPLDIVGDSSSEPAPKKRIVRKKRTRKRKEQEESSIPTPSSTPIDTSPTHTPERAATKQRKPRRSRKAKTVAKTNPSKDSNSLGRLIPIVKRTKRVKKINPPLPK